MHFLRDISEQCKLLQTFSKLCERLLFGNIKRKLILYKCKCTNTSTVVHLHCLVSYL